MHPYRNYVAKLAELSAAGRQLPLGTFDACASASIATDAPVALLFSPHPDDECITGLLPLRLMREAGWRIINVPVTHGSRVDRQVERHDELRRACAFLGWDWVERTPQGDFVSVNGRGTDMPFPPLAPDILPLLAAFESQDIVRIFKTFPPAAIFVPHAADWNARHISTHKLVMNALGQMGSDFSCRVVETEFWGAMTDPNLMVEGDVELVGDLVAATSFHVKEVIRNPYHILLPAWMQDNVRRGGELVGGQGHAAPDFAFATLYRMSCWRQSQLMADEGGKRFCAVDDNIKEWFDGNHN